MELKKKKCKVCGELRLTVDESGRCILCRSKYIGPGIEIKQTSNGNKGGTEIKSKTRDYKKENGWMSKF